MCRGNVEGGSSLLPLRGGPPPLSPSVSEPIPHFAPKQRRSIRPRPRSPPSFLLKPPPSPFSQDDPPRWSMYSIQRCRHAAQSDGRVILTD